MKMQFECPQCHDYRLCVTHNDVYYRSFGVNLLLAVVCFVVFEVSVAMRVLNLVAIIGVLIFFINAFSAMVKILSKKADKTVCEKCGYQYIAE